ncbi:MAG TPA: hypothetical protein VMH81_11080 [Bryobacteraceae bacterium]|nr:hypothetical protein [Bryobacteraceae bacterium]
MGTAGANPIDRKGSFSLLGGVVGLVCAVLVVYSQTAAFHWDEGFHLLAAQLIHRGRRPYLDFCFPQTPLNAYWTAGWMRLIGESWRAVHALAAAATAGTILVAADFIRTRFPDPQWRTPGAATTALVLGWNVAIIEFGTIGQPYAFCLLLLVCAFRAAVVAVERQGLLRIALAGLLAGAAAASSLLTAASVPVLLIWILYHAPGKRWAGCSSFAGGAAIPWLPVVWLFSRAPRIVFFNLVQYQLLYRRTNWEDATPHDLEVLTSWWNSPTALLLGVLAITGLWCIAKRSGWKASSRSGFYLCGWLALGIGVEVGTTHPTFPSYWVLVTPFLGMPAAAGLYAAGALLGNPVRARWLVPALAVLMAVGLATSLPERHSRLDWRDMERLARKVNEVTPAGGAIWADEQVYFLTGRPPAEGTEFSYAEVIDLPEDVSLPLHIVSDIALDDQAAAGVFQTVSTCEDEEVVGKLRLPSLFRRQQVMESGCRVFWEPVNSLRPDQASVGR